MTKLNAGNEDREYKVEAIWDSTIYARESESGHHLPELYYLVFWKEYLEEKNIWESPLAVQHLIKLINSFHKDHFYKPTAIFEAIDIASPMARLTVRLTTTTKPRKKKQGRPANNSNK